MKQLFFIIVFATMIAACSPSNNTSRATAINDAKTNATDWYIDNQVATAYAKATKDKFKTKITTPTPERSTCLTWQDITLEDVGSELCVEGSVKYATNDGTAYQIRFTDEPGNFFILSYDREFPEFRSGSCVSVEGEVEKLGTSPVIVVKYHNTINDCNSSRSNTLDKWTDERETEVSGWDSPEKPTVEPTRIPSISNSCPSGCRTPPLGCRIKGNISINSSEKIYHMPGDEYYDETIIKPEYGERWFCSSADAEANGWRRAYK